MHSSNPTNNNLLDNVFPHLIPNIPYQPPQNFQHSGSQLWNPYTWEHHPSPHSLSMAISALISVNHNLPQTASHILHPALNLLIQSSVSHSGGIFDPKINIPKDISTIFKNLGLEPTLEAYVSFPQWSC
ncbi:hypothetical protein O181_051233 [Austropuccinia psidii MF-1]|uniref:Uncharacterized protein n=1 Tax=Austropuccinia psidii MF-1 TaxID=1389203 RepID=A0A9Q3E0K4_9BASI|nr:hypothetical protein [Austropuccinia psidii MF-1]